jgi:hypothetical protein
VIAGAPSAALLPLKKYAVISLWEMHIRTAEKLASMTLVIAQLLDNARGMDSMHARGKAWFEDQFRTIILPEAKSLGLKTTAKLAEQFAGNIDGYYQNHNRMREAVFRIEQVMRAELSTVQFIYIPEDKLDYLDATTAFGPTSFRSFPTSQYDVEHAGKCIAIGANTACVTHLMRALEFPLTALASAAGLKPKKESWGRLLEDIQAAIKAPGRTDDERQFLGEAATSFDNIRVAWRNEAMHGRRVFDEEEASKIWSTARELFKHLSIRLAE